MDVWHPAYPTTEYGGLVFVYMGPPGTEPLFSLYDIIDTRHRDDVVLRGMRLWATIPSALSKTAIGCSTTRTSLIHGIY
jgi:hypothetical protein